MRSLTTYSLEDLTDLQAQGTALLPTLAPDDAARMVDLLATLAGEIADRRGPANLAATVCGYDEDGGLLVAVQNHRFQHIARSSRR